MIILLSGKQGSGKSTLAASLSRELGAPVVKFADPLYECHDAVWDVLERYGIEREKKSGDLLQAVGDFGRRRDPLLWVKLAAAEVADLEPKFPAVIIDDCRFENEFRAFPNALSVRLYCDRDIRKSRTESWRENEDHPSEVGLDHLTMSFNLVLNTGARNAEEILRTVLEQASLRIPAITPQGVQP